MRATVLVSAGLTRALALALSWSDAGDTVTVVLCDEAAAAARRGHAANAALAGATAAGVTLAAHEDALRRRGVTRDRIVDGVKVVDLDEIADLIAEGGARAVWL